MISWERVAELKSEVGEEDFLEIVHLFLGETDAVLARLGETADPDETEALLHFLKGSALNLGFQRLSALCRGLNELDDTNRKWPPDLPELREAYEMSKRLLLSANGR